MASLLHDLANVRAIFIHAKVEHHLAADANPGG